MTERLTMYILAALNGALALVAWQQNEAVASAQDTVAKARADVRTATSQKLDADERHEDEMRAVQSSAEARLYEKDQALEACQRAGAPGAKR